MPRSRYYSAIRKAKLICLGWLTGTVEQRAESGSGRDTSTHRSETTSIGQAGVILSISGTVLMLRRGQIEKEQRCSQERKRSADPKDEAPQIRCWRLQSPSTPLASGAVFIRIGFPGRAARSAASPVILRSTSSHHDDNSPIFHTRSPMLASMDGVTRSALWILAKLYSVRTWSVRRRIGRLRWMLPGVINHDFFLRLPNRVVDSLSRPHLETVSPNIVLMLQLITSPRIRTGRVRADPFIATDEVRGRSRGQFVPPSNNMLVMGQNCVDGRFDPTPGFEHDRGLRTRPVFVVRHRSDRLAHLGLRRWACRSQSALPAQHESPRPPPRPVSQRRSLSIRISRCGSPQSLLLAK